MRYVVNVLVITGLIFSFFGCGRKETQVGQITISIACPYSAVDVGVQTIEESLIKYEQLNPDVQINKLWGSGTGVDYFQKLMTMIAGGTPPDIFRTSPDWIPKFVQTRTVLPLNDFLKESKVLTLDDFFPQVLWKYRFDGKFVGRGPIYGLGTDWSPDFTLFYNKDLFDKAGISYPDKSLSWDEFLDMAKKLTIRDSEGRAQQFGTIPPDLNLPLIYQNEGMVFSEDGKICLLDSTEATEALKFFNDCINTYRVTPSIQDRDLGDTLSLFQTGRLAMFFSGRHFAANVDNVVKDKFRWGIGPSLHKVKRVNVVLGPFGWAVSNKTKYPKEVWKLLEYLVAGEGGIKLAEVGYNIPVLKKVAYSDVFLTNPKHRPEGINRVFIDEIEYSVPSPVNPYVPTERWIAIMRDELDMVALKMKTPEQAAKDMAKRINTLIKENLIE